MKRAASFVTLLSSSAFFSSAVVHAATPYECEVLIYGPSGAPLNDASTPMTPVPPGTTPPGGTTTPGSTPTPSPTPTQRPGSSGGSSRGGGYAPKPGTPSVPTKTMSGGAKVTTRTAVGTGQSGTRLVNIGGCHH